MRFIFTFILSLSVITTLLQLFGCSASNCPLENTVTCNYGFYDSEGNPVYHTFKTVAELDAFYTQAFRYVNQCLNEGWAIKDNFDWTPYEEALEHVTD